MHPNSNSDVAMTQTLDSEYEGFLQSKFNRVFLILLTMVLLFAGPTYVPFLMFNVLNLNYLAAISVGTVLFVLGVVMLVYLIRKKVFT
jgi:hypothetical protein